MTDENEIVADWIAWRVGAPMREALTFTNAGLVLGRGTIVAPFKKGAPEDGGSASHAWDEPAIIALLTATFARPIAVGAVEKMRRAAALWHGGEKSLAQIHLALAGLPRIREWDAYCLHLAEKALKRGVSPSRLLKRLGFEDAALELEKKYNRDQPRVPPGSGRESGRWTSAGGGSAGKQKIVRRADVRVVGATRSDASPAGVVPGAQYAQANPTPVISAEVMKQEVHFAGAPDQTKGKFVRNTRPTRRSMSSSRPPGNRRHPLTSVQGVGIRDEL